MGKRIFFIDIEEQYEYTGFCLNSPSDFIPTNDENEYHQPKTTKTRYIPGKKNIKNIFNKFYRTRVRSLHYMLLPMSIDISEVFKCKHSFPAHFK